MVRVSGSFWMIHFGIQLMDGDPVAPHWPPANFSAQLALNLVPEPSAKTVLNSQQEVSKLPRNSAVSRSLPTAKHCQLQRLLPPKMPQHESLVTPHHHPVDIEILESIVDRGGFLNQRGDHPEEQSVRQEAVPVAPVLRLSVDEACQQRAIPARLETCASSRRPVAATARCTASPAPPPPARTAARRIRTSPSTPACCGAPIYSARAKGPVTAAGSANPCPDCSTGCASPPWQLWLDAS